MQEGFEFCKKNGKIDLFLQKFTLHGLIIFLLFILQCMQVVEFWAINNWDMRKSEKYKSSLIMIELFKDSFCFYNKNIGEDRSS